ERYPVLARVLLESLGNRPSQRVAPIVRPAEDCDEGAVGTAERSLIRAYLPTQLGVDMFGRSRPREHVLERWGTPFRLDAGDGLVVPQRLGPRCIAEALGGGEPPGDQRLSPLVTVGCANQLLGFDRPGFGPHRRRDRTDDLSEPPRFLPDPGTGG